MINIEEFERKNFFKLYEIFVNIYDSVYVDFLDENDDFKKEDFILFAGKELWEDFIKEQYKKATEVIKDD